MIPKICLFCESFYFTQGEYGYSEYTPNIDMTMGCREGIWRFDSYDDDLHDCMAKAQTCKFFTLDEWAKKKYNLKEE